MTEISEIVVRRSQLPADKRLKRQLDRHVDRMRMIAEVAREGMDEVSDIHRYGAYKAVSTIYTSELIRKAASCSDGRDTEGETTFAEAKKKYLTRMTQIEDSACLKIVSEVAGLELVSEDNGSLSEIITCLLTH